jgi:hypothetical protein
VNSQGYAAAINEVNDLGSKSSTTRTAEKTITGKFWAAPIQNYWSYPGAHSTISATRLNDAPRSPHALTSPAPARRSAHRRAGC